MLERIGFDYNPNTYDADKAKGTRRHVYISSVFSSDTIINDVTSWP